MAETIVVYTKNPEAVADAIKLMAYFERRYLERQAAKAKAGEAPPAKSPGQPEPQPAA
ncbi:MAG: hypothetical protein ACM3XZ_03360 [Betaproteobacteria bacterium]